MGKLKKQLRFYDPSNRLVTWKVDSYKRALKLVSRYDMRAAFYVEKLNGQIVKNERIH